MGKIIAVHSYKGGTGKTLLSINLAALYANRGKSICLLDLDFRAPSLQAIFKVRDVEYWINDYLNGVCDIKKVLKDLSMTHVRRGRFFVGLANPSTEAIREMTAKDRKWEMKALGRLLSLKTSLINDMQFDYVIFDTSPGLQYSSINAIVSSDVALVVSGTDISDIRGTKRMIEELYELFEKKTGLIMNKVLAEVLALIADMDPVYRPERPAPADSEDERLWEDATAFGAALDKLFDRHMGRKAAKAGRRRSGIWLG